MYIGWFILDFLLVLYSTHKKDTEYTFIYKNHAQQVENDKFVGTQN